MLIKAFSILLLILFSLSCTRHLHTVGKGPEKPNPTTVVHDKMKSVYLFWGLIPLHKEKMQIPNDENYLLISAHQPEDALLTLLSFGIFSPRTIKVLAFKNEQLDKCLLKVNDKVAAKADGKPITGKIVGTDNKSRKISILYKNIYGENKIECLPCNKAKKLTFEEYAEASQKLETEIEKYKFKIGQYASWPMNGSVEFGIVQGLDYRSHKASMALSNIYDEQLLIKVPIFELTLLSENEYLERSLSWDDIKADYQFNIGERVQWEDKKNGKSMGTILSLNNSNHSAQIEYRDSEGKLKKTNIGLLKLTRLE